MRKSHHLALGRSGRENVTDDLAGNGDCEALKEPEEMAHIISSGPLRWIYYFYIIPVFIGIPVCRLIPVLVPVLADL